MNQLPDQITIGEKYNPAMEITDQSAADAYFEICVEHTQRLLAAAGKDASREAAEAMERTNLGYYAGYYDNATRQRLELLFKCSHPVFGSIAHRGAPPPEEAFQRGLEAGRIAK